MTNYRKFFIYNIAFSRYYWPLAGIYFLTLPNSTAQQIGIYVMVAQIAQFFLEIPSWYFGDRFGHKKTLILAQICMFIAATSFALATNVRYFIFGAFFMAAGQSLNSGTNEAFFHEMLEDQWQEKQFWIQWAKFKGNVAIVSMLFLFVYPRIWEINLTLPFWISAGLSLIWTIVGVSLSEPKHQHHIEEQSSITTLIKEQKHTGFYLTAIFFAIIGGVYVSETSFREPFVVDLWLSIGLISIMIGLSRGIMRIFSKSKLFKKLDTLPLKKFMLLDLGIMSLGYILAGINGNAYITMLLFSLIIGYRQSRRSIISKHLLLTLKNKNYKATLLSIYSQLESLLAGGIVFGLGYLMHWSYGKWFIIIGCLLLVVLSVYYSTFVRKKAINANYEIK